MLYLLCISYPWKTFGATILCSFNLGVRPCLNQWDLLLGKDSYDHVVLKQGAYIAVLKVMPEFIGIEVSYPPVLYFSIECAVSFEKTLCKPH